MDALKFSPLAPTALSGTSVKSARMAPGLTGSLWAYLRERVLHLLPRWEKIRMDTLRFWSAAMTVRSGISGKQYPEMVGAIGTRWARRPTLLLTLPPLCRRMPMAALRLLPMVLMVLSGIVGKWRQA